MFVTWIVILGNNINLSNSQPSVLSHCYMFLVKNRVFGLLDRIFKLPVIFECILLSLVCFKHQLRNLPKVTSKLLLMKFEPLLPLPHPNCPLPQLCCLLSFLFLSSFSFSCILLSFTMISSLFLCFSS